MAWIERGFEGFNVFYDGWRFFGIPADQGEYHPDRKTEYQPLLRAKTAHRVRQLIRYYNRLPKDFWGKFWSEPIYKLPLRVCKKVAHMAVRMMDR